MGWQLLNITIIMKMKIKSIPSQFDELITFASDVHLGLERLGTGLGAMDSAEQLTTAMAAAETAERAFQESRSLPVAVLNPAQDKADREGDRFIQTAKNVMRNEWGGAWSANWASLGFVNGSLKTPSKMAEREAMLQRMGAFFTAHPDQEVADLEVTADRANELYDALKMARSAKAGYRSAHRTKRVERNAAVKALKKALRWVINDLRMKLAEDDSRWHEFGLVGQRSAEPQPAAGAEGAAPGAFGQQPVLLPDPDSEDPEEDAIAEAA